MQLVATKSEAISATMLRFISSYVAECLVDGAMPVHQSLTGCRISLESIVDVEGVLMPTTTGVRYTTISTIELSIQRLYVVSYAQPLPFSLEQQPSISVGRQQLSLMLRVRLLRDMDPRAYCMHLTYAIARVPASNLPNDCGCAVNACAGVSSVPARPCLHRDPHAQARPYRGTSTGLAFASRYTCDVL